MEEVKSVLVLINRVQHIYSTLKSIGFILEGNYIEIEDIKSFYGLFDCLVSALDTLPNEEDMFTADFFKISQSQVEQIMVNRFKQTIFNN